MSPKEILAAARKAGAAVRLEDGRMVVVAVTSVPADIRDALERHKAATIELLCAEDGKSWWDGKRLTFGELMATADEDAEDDDWDDEDEDDWRATDTLPDGAADRDSGGALLKTMSCVPTISQPRSGKCCRPEHQREATHVRQRALQPYASAPRRQASATPWATRR